MYVTASTPVPPGSGSRRLAAGLAAAGALVLAVALVLILGGGSGDHRSRVRPAVTTFSGPFSQTNAQHGTLRVDPSRPYDGAPSLRASFDGGAVNGYERGIYNVRWNTGDTVTYSAAFFLPAGFKARMQGEVDLMRWDNFPSHPDDTDWGGVVIFHGDRLGRLLRFDKTGTGLTELSPAFDVPEGRWFRLEVRQHLSPVDGEASSALYVDGRLIGRSTRANTYGRAIERIRYGIVAVDATLQANPLTLWFARTRAVSQTGG